MNRSLEIITNKLTSIDELARQVSLEHKVMFGALAEIRDAIDAVPILGEGGDYLSQLLEFRRKADAVLTRTWDSLGLS